MICSLGFAACAQVGEHGVDAVLVDQAQAGVRNAQTHPTIFAFNPETAVLQVRKKTTLGLVVRVGNVVAAHRRFPSYLAYACHESTPNTLKFCVRATYKFPGTRCRQLLSKRPDSA